MPDKKSAALKALLDEITRLSLCVHVDIKMEIKTSALGWSVILTNASHTVISRLYRWNDEVRDKHFMTMHLTPEGLVIS